MSQYTIETVGDYVVVRRAADRTVICDARATLKTLRDIRFADPSYQRSNVIRQTAMRALQSAGYR